MVFVGLAAWLLLIALVAATGGLASEANKRLLAVALALTLAGIVLARVGFQEH
jgi:low temperature requirement protein LtrA